MGNMSSKNQDLFKIFRDVKIRELNKNYTNIAREGNNSKFLLLNLNEFSSCSYDELKNMIDSLTDSSNRCLELKKQFLLELCDIKFNYTNERFNKVKKYKIIYFLYGLMVNFDSTINPTSKYNAKNFFAISNLSEIKWCAFVNGPILSNYYNYFECDNEIKINWDSFEENQKKIFELGFITLDSLSITQLVNESHKTTPWIKNFQKGEYYTSIPLEEIDNYFKKEKPFFLNSLNN